MAKEKETRNELDILKTGFEQPKRVLDPSYYRSLLSSRSNLTLGQKAADNLTKWAGSWFFIILLGIFIAIWIFLNLTAFINNWDPWPFIILNLCLSCLAAVQAPIILMSQNRSVERDRLRSEYDYSVNRKAEREIRELKKDVNSILRYLQNHLKK
jgi:uncharacterized membrane protein